MPSLRSLAATALTALILLGLEMTASHAADAIGAVSRVQGAAAGVLDGVSERLDLDSTVFLNQSVTTGEAARLEITFRDGTQLTLGERAEMTLDRFVYDPAQGIGEMQVGVVGAFRFISGQVSRISGSNVAVVTPVATVGIRGTDFWGGPIDGAFGVLLLEGAVSVLNAFGAVVLDEPGEGTNIAGPGAAPGAVTTWPQDKVDRAFATVTFQ